MTDKDARTPKGVRASYFVAVAVNRSSTTTCVF